MTTRMYLDQELEEVRACHVCSSVEVALTLDRGVGLRVHECADCGLAYLSPRPSTAALRHHYEREYANQRMAHLARDSVAFDIQGADARWIEPLMGKNGLRGASVLDVGCGPGLLLDALNRRGAARLIGIEPGIKAAAFAQRMLPGATIVRAPFEEAGSVLKGETFDLVCGFDLIEHLQEPRVFVRWVRERLAPCGLLCLKTPNWGAVRRYGESWEGLWRDFEHLYYFSHASLKLLLAQEGLEVVAVTYEPYRVGLGGTDKLTSRAETRGLIDLARKALRPIPGVNRVAYSALRALRSWRSRGDIRAGTAHGMMLAARHQTSDPLPFAEARESREDR